MPASRHAEIVVLGVLAAGERHGYAVNQEINRLGARRWARVGVSTVYRVLERLDAAGLVSRRSERRGARPRRAVYSLTESGRRRLEVLVLRGLASDEPPRSDRLVAAVFSGRVGGQRAATAIVQAIQTLRRQQQELTEALDAAAPGSVAAALARFYRRLAPAERATLAELSQVAADGPD